jgi:CDGSH-type Zn-finger protein
MLARQGDRLGEFASLDRDHLVPIACDLTDPTAVTAAFETAEKKNGPLECAVFNAGTFRPGSILDTTPEDFEHCWRIGAFAGFLVGQEAARRMVARAAGTILFTGATASFRGALSPPTWPPPNSPFARLRRVWRVNLAQRAFTSPTSLSMAKSDPSASSRSLPSAGSIAFWTPTRLQMFICICISNHDRPGHTKSTYVRGRRNSDRPASPRTCRSSLMEPKVSQKSPIAAELQAGKTIYWCTCGQSANQPYCDGSHKGSTFAPLPYTPAASGTAYLCACKHSKNPPLCDGSHQSL